MAFNSSMTSQNQQSPTDNINTRGIQLYNGDATIVLDYWNGLATVKIHPALPESERQNKQVYDYKKSVSVTLTPENAVLLGKYIREDITPALAKGEECTRAIISARVNMIVVSTGVGEHGEVKPYVAVYRKINENRIPEEAMAFFLDKHPVVTKFNPSTGDFAADQAYTEIYVLEQFFTACTALMSADVHAHNYANRFRINREYEFRAAAGSKLGIETDGNRTNYVNRTSAGSSQNIWDTKTPTDTLASAGAPTAETSTASMDSLADLI